MHAHVAIFYRRFTQVMATKNKTLIRNKLTRLLVVCGPSGSGKSSFLNEILKEYPDKFGFSVSHTTRKPRPSEINNVHYHFTDRESMEEAITRGEFVEHATYSGNLYGTSKNSILDVVKYGKVCILDIDVKGADQIKRTGMDALLIFIKPPSMMELEKRLRARKTETDENLAKRLEVAKMELKYGLLPGNYQYIITNDNFDASYLTFKQIVFKHFQFN